MQPRPGSENWRLSWSGDSRADRSGPQTLPWEAVVPPGRRGTGNPALTGTPAARKRRAVEVTVPERKLQTSPLWLRAGVFQAQIPPKHPEKYPEALKRPFSGNQAHGAHLRAQTDVDRSPRPFDRSLRRAPG